jgi:drug/metabolite transporter (DMT)-like permease
MIQRKQTIWLLLAALMGFLFTQIPLFIAKLADGSEKKFSAPESLILFAFGIAVALLAVFTIFLFKNRPLQLRLTIIGILASLAIIGLEVWQLDQFKQNNAVSSGSYYWGSLFPIASLLFFALAAGGIRKDEKLVKSLDRLR